MNPHDTVRLTARERAVRTSLRTRIDTLATDGAAHELTSAVRLPPRPGPVEIRYSTLSLTIPGRVHVRHRLTGRNSIYCGRITRRSSRPDAA